MKLSSQQYVEVIRPHLPSALVSSAHLDLISEVAAALPPASNYCLECRLAEPELAADYLVAVVASDGSLGAWANESSLEHLPETARAHPLWRKVQGLLASWHTDPALAPIHDTWLELDLPSSQTEFPAPSFFFGFDDQPSGNYPELAFDLVERLLERPMPESRRKKFQECYDQLPGRSLIFQVGLLFARESEEIRFCTRRMARAEIPKYLQALGWSGSTESLRALLDDLAPMVSGIDLDISIEEEVFPSIGLECYFSDGAAGKAQAQAFKNYLVEKGVCLPEKGEAIFEWLGYSTEKMDAEIWPPHLRKASKAMGPDVLSTFARTLNHIKLGFQEDALTSAKVYLGVRHFWARDRSGAPTESTSSGSTSSESTSSESTSSESTS